MIIYNKHSIQTKFIPEWFNDTIGVDDIKEAMSYVKDSEQTYVLIGFYVPKKVNIIISKGRTRTLLQT